MTAALLFALALLLLCAAILVASIRDLVTRLIDADQKWADKMMDARLDGFHAGLDYASGNGVYGRVLNDGEPPDPPREPRP